MPDLPVVQKEWLLDCLKSNKNSRLGKKFNFSAVLTIKDYQRQIPLHYYEDLKPWIDESAQGEKSVLFDDEVIAFERTSGSSHYSKLIPYSEKSLLDFQKAILPWLKNVTEQYALNTGFVYWALSPAARSQEFTDSGIAIGLPDERYFGEKISDFFTLQQAVPQWVGSIEDVNDWQIYTLYWLIRRKELALISVWSPTFFIVLIETIEIHYSSLLNLLSLGGSYYQYNLASDKKAYQRLKRYIDDGDSRILWPNLKLVSCWADASSAVYNKQLQTMLHHACFQAKGLLLTEGVVTIPDRDGQTILAANSGFFEFIKDDTVYLAHELEIQECYEVVITTSGGLYRYRTQDIVICKGYSDTYPILLFKGRAGIQSDLVGEKLTDSFVSACLSSLSGFSMLVPCKEKTPYYQLLLDKVDYTEHSELKEEIAEEIEQKLTDNPQYAYARKMGQLGKLQVYSIKQPLEQYLQCMMKSGMRMGDIKIPALMSNSECFKMIKKDLF